MTLARIEAAARPFGLAVLGACHPRPDDGAPEGCRTLVLLGPDSPRLWPVLRASREMADGCPDPLDRWSARVIGRLADRFGATACFPFGGRPYAPFTAWARRSGQVFDSPVGLLVHGSRGLLVSFRGALALPRRLALPAPARRPCDGCPAPCLAACPVGALSGAGYELPACHSFLDTPAGGDCMTRGCAVRRACPVGQNAQPPAQAGFHMAAFHGRGSACDG